MKKTIFLYLFLCFTINLCAQKEANVWYFGEKTGLDFNSGTPIVLSNGQMDTEEGCATISDNQGQLLFYTDGTTVWNKNHQIMPNGKGLMGHSSSTQASVIVPKPENPNIYYIFTTTEADDPRGARYSEVDLSLNNGLGDVTVKKNFLLFTPTCEKITAVKIPSSGELWVVLHEFKSDRFFSYKITTNGVESTPVISNTGIVLDNKKDQSVGSLKFSPDGTKLVSCNYYRNVELYDFDGSTGKISNPRTVMSSIDNANYGVEFSPSGNFVYVTYGNSYYPDTLLQFDLRSPDIPSTETIIYNGVTNLDILAALQIATNGKIYGLLYDKSFLFAINNPDAKGAACNFELNAVSLGPNLVCNHGLPSFIQSYFMSTIEVGNNCHGVPTSFKLSSSQSVTSAVWDFGDGIVSTEISPTHTYASSGTYSVSVKVNNNSIKTTEITISEIPTATQPKNILVCDNNNDGFYKFDLTTQDNLILNGQDWNKYKVTYYSNNTPISFPSNYTNSTAYQAEKITAEVSNKENSTCKSTTSFYIDVFDSPFPELASNIPDLVDCDNTSVGTDTDGKITFDLTRQKISILNGEPSAQFFISYYTDSGLTQEILLPSAYKNTNPEETIFAKITNMENHNCTATTSFKIKVLPLPIINSIVNLKQCDDDIDGFSIFNLEEALGKIRADTSIETISFFKTMSDAKNNTNSIQNPIKYINKTVNNDIVFARISNANDCFKIAQLNLIISTTQIPTNFSKTFTVCDDETSGSNTDGISTFDFNSITDQVKTLFPSGQLLDVTYYRNLQDALSEKNNINNISNYSNINYPHSQKIYIRVDSRLNNDCLGLGGYITLNVESTPIVKSLTKTHCDDDYDGLFAFDTSTIETQILNGLNNVSISYWDQNNNLLSSPLPNPFTTASQTIKVKVTNKTVTACSFYTELKFVVDVLPLAFSIPFELTTACDDEIDPQIQDGKYPFNTTGFQDIILGNQTGMIVKYYDANGVSLTTPLPNPFLTTSQKIKAEVINTSNTNCTAELWIPFIVNKIPDIKLTGEELVCSDLPTFTKVINAGLTDETKSSDFTYSWTLNENVIVGKTQYDLTINKEGIYKVQATNNAGCVRTRIITVNASDKAKVKIDTIDLAEENSITILATGNGDYVFSLNDEFGEYQNSNVFNNVPAGIHTVYVKDLNGCGTVKNEVAVLGIPKFFTPNQDGSNDYWNIKGVNHMSNAKTNIQIFDRFGKLLKQISPLDIGWDGTYNNMKMPATDYWYVIKLEDNRIFKGHFALKR